MEVRIISTKNLAYWKEGYVTMRNLAEKATGRAKREYKRAAKYAQHRIDNIESKVLFCVVLLALAGCNMVHGALKDAEWIAGKGAENTEVKQEQK